MLTLVLWRSGDSRWRCCKSRSLHLTETAWKKMSNTLHEGFCCESQTPFLTPGNHSYPPKILQNWVLRFFLQIKPRGSCRFQLPEVQNSECFFLFYLNLPFEKNKKNSFLEMFLFLSQQFVAENLVHSDWRASKSVAPQSVRTPALSLWWGAQISVDLFYDFDKLTCTYFQALPASVCKHQLILHVVFIWVSFCVPHGNLLLGYFLIERWRRI